MSIDYQDTSIDIEGTPLLQHVTLQAAPGEFIYLIGKVGTGKSTLLRTLYGEIPIRQPHAYVLDTDLTHLKQRHIPALRRKIGVVFQDFRLLTDRNVHDNLDFVLKAIGCRKKSQREERIAQVLDQVGMQDKADHMPYQLSRGEQQCICIARAILGEPQLLIADEPTGNLDRDNAIHITQLLYDISRKGVTVLLSTHNEELINRFPGIVYRCSQGTITPCTQDFGQPYDTQDITTGSIAYDTPSTDGEQATPAADADAAEEQ